MVGFDLGGTVNDAADWVCNAPLVRGVINNPVFTALLITALVVIVIMAQQQQKCSAKSIFYIFLIITTVIFVHHYAVLQITQEHVTTTGVRSVFSSIQQSREMPGSIHVVPMCTFNGGDEDVYSKREDNVAALDSTSLLHIQDVTIPNTGGLRK